MQNRNNHHHHHHYQSPPLGPVRARPYVPAQRRTVVEDRPTVITFKKRVCHDAVLGVLVNLQAAGRSELLVAVQTIELLQVPRTTGRYNTHQYQSTEV